MRTPHGNDYTLRLVRLPATIYGAAVLLDDGTYDVFINNLLSEEAQQRALSHELEHIDREHLYDDLRSVSVMEAEANGTLLPDVFFDRPSGTIPVFSSLDSFKHYLVTYAAQRRSTL